ncbi:MAG: hypothetical protein U0103_28860 [Candidatus Obscuribacterales bacterium]
MKYQELIAQVRADPCGSNFAAMQRWLDKRQKDSTSVYEVLFAFIQMKPEAETFQWLECWLESREWFSLDSLVHIRNVNCHEWLINYGAAHPRNPHIVSLWKNLLISFKYESLIEAASDWLVDFGSGKDSVLIAELLLPMTKAAAVQQKSVELLREFPSEFTVSTLIKHIGDEESIQLGLEIMNATSTETGVFAAAALLENDDLKNWAAVQQWLLDRWHEKYIPFALGYLMDVSPLVVAPLALKWIDEHPNSKKVSRIFSTGVTLKPSPELFDLIWRWLEPRASKRYCPEILTVLFSHWGRFKTPAGALVFADAWLERNEGHGLYENILLGAIGEGSTEFRIELARRWLASRSDALKGHMLMNLRRRAPEYFTDEALDWAYRNPDEIESQVIKYEYFRDTKNERGVTVEEIEEFVDSNVFSKEHLCEKVRLKDEMAIAWAKALLKTPRIELKFSESTKCRNAPILVALYEALPTDTDVLAEVDRWFKSDESVCNEHLEMMRKAVGRKL